MTGNGDGSPLEITPKYKAITTSISNLAIEMGLEAAEASSIDRFLEKPSLAALVGIPKSKQTKEMVDLAIEGYRLAAESGGYISPDLKYASQKLLDRDTCLTACECNGLNIRHVPQRFKDYEMYLTAVRENPSCLCAVPEQLVDESLLIAAVSNNRHPGSLVLKEALKHTDKIRSVSELCNRAVMADPESIGIIPSRYLTMELCHDAVSRKPSSLSNVPPRFQSEELCRLAIENEPLLLGIVPHKKITDEMIWKAVKCNPLALKYVPWDFMSDSLVTMAVENTEIPPKWRQEWPIAYVPDKYLRPHPARRLNHLVETSLSIDPYSISVISDSHLTVKAVKRLIEVHPEIYRRLSEATKLRKSIAELAVKLDEANESYLPDSLRGKIFFAKDVVPIAKAPRVSISTAQAEETDKALHRGEHGILQSLHDSTQPNCQKRLIHYITDIHIEHQLELVNAQYADVVACVRKKTDELVTSRHDEDLFMLAGDIAPSVQGLNAFFDAYSLSVGRSGSRGTLLYVLGNHELWSGQVPGVPFDFDSLIAEYRMVCKKRWVTILENGLYVEYKNRLGRVIDERTLLSTDDDDLSALLKQCRLIVLGGCGFSGIGDGIKVDLASFGRADDQRSRRFRLLYDKLLCCACHKKVIILTHYPMEEWSTEPKNPTWIYVSGHTHRNYFSDGEGEPTILSDGQIGYRETKWAYRAYALDTTNYCNPLACLKDGIYEIDAQTYEDFNRARGIEMCKFNRGGRIFALKRGNIYMFVHRGEDGGNLHLLAGGHITNLSQADIGYYYRNLAEYSARVERLFAPYYSALTAVSKEVKSIGGDGYIHGSIVDIDYFNHIYLDPIDGSLTPYYAESTEERVSFKSVNRLLKDSPFIDGCIKRNFLRSRKHGELAMLASGKSEYEPSPALAPVLSTDKAMYAKSNAMKSVQYLLERNVVRIWNDRVLEGNSSIGIVGSASEHAKGLIG